MALARTSPARRHSATSTFRCVTARTVRVAKAETSTPSSCARRTTVAASGSGAGTRKMTILVCTVARSISALVPATYSPIIRALA